MDMRYNRKEYKFACCAPTSNMIHGRSTSAAMHSVSESSVQELNALWSPRTACCRLFVCGE